MGWASTLAEFVAEWWHSNASIIALAELAILLVSGIWTYRYRRSLMGRVGSLTDQVGSLTSKIDFLVAKMVEMVGKTPEEQRRLVDEAVLTDFDVPILDAIHYIAQATPSSYQGSRAIELHAFGVLHRRMCEGKLPVAGRLGEDGDLRQISSQECKMLVPQEVVVPLHPTAPNGVMFALIYADELESLPTAVEMERVQWYVGLRVRSRDLYRLWPRNHPG